MGSTEEWYRRRILGDWTYGNQKEVGKPAVDMSVLTGLASTPAFSAQLQRAVEEEERNFKLRMFERSYHPPSYLLSAKDASMLIRQHMPPEVVVDIKVPNNFEREIDELIEEMEKMPLEDLEEFEKYVREELHKTNRGDLKFGGLQATLMTLKEFKDKKDLEENKQEIVEAFKYAKQGFTSIFNSAIKALEEAESVNEIMVAKKELLLNLIEELPLGGDTCIFCEMYDDRCSLCDYAHKYGHRVCNSKNSSWATIQDAQDTLKNVIEREYWSEEE